MRISDWSSDVCSSDLQLAIDHERCARHPPCADQIIDAFRFNRSASFSRTSAPDKAQSLMREPKCAMPSPTMKRYDKSFIGMRAGSIGSIAPCFAPVIMTTQRKVRTEEGRVGKKG